MPSAIILAAGSSTRMGRQKLLLPLGENTIIEKTIDAVKKSDCFDEILMVYKEEALRQIADCYDIKPIYNENAHEGIGSSVRIGVQSARKDADAFMFFCGDQPFISQKMISLLIHSYKTSKMGTIIVPRYDGKNGMPTIFPALWKNELLSLQGDMGGRSIIAKNTDRINWVDMPQSDGYFDIDTEEDYRSVTLKLKISKGLG